MKSYRHQLKGTDIKLPTGKVVCVGRNYADHARELNNPVPTRPLLFIKPSTAVVPMADSIAIPANRGECHHELELALLIGQPLTAVEPEQVPAAITGFGLALDLTLRDRQSELKAKGQPWEEAKAFDGSCPLSIFVAPPPEQQWQQLSFHMLRNGQLQQQGNTADMLFPIVDLVAAMSQHFTLLPGDVVLTGTPSGVGPLQVGDQLQAQLAELLTVNSEIN